MQEATNHDVFQNREIAERTHDLEGPSDAALTDFGSGKTGDVLTQESDCAFGGLICTGDHVECGGLAGTVGTDQTHGFSLGHIQVQVIHGSKTAETHRQPFCLQDFICHR